MTEAIFYIASLHSFCTYSLHSLQTSLFANPGSLGPRFPFLGHLLIGLNNPGDCKWCLQHWKLQFILTAMKIHSIMTLFFFSDSVSPIRSWQLKKKIENFVLLRTLHDSKNFLNRFCFPTFHFGLDFSAALTGTDNYCFSCSQSSGKIILNQILNQVPPSESLVLVPSSSLEISFSPSSQSYITRI